METEIDPVHGPSCFCQQCQVLGVFSDARRQIEPEDALVTLIPVTCALLAQLDATAIDDCLAFMKETAVTMMKTRAARAPLFASRKQASRA